MKSIQITRPREVCLKNVGPASAGADSILLDVKAVGMCGTDLRTYTGQNPIVQYPRVFGHEIAALLHNDSIIATKTWPAGTPVTVNPYTACGTCASCRRGRSYACQFNQTLGNQRDGAAVEQFAIPSDHVYVLPGFSSDMAVCVEPLSVGFHAVSRGRIAQGETVVVLGNGMIGLGAVIAAYRRGARVIAVDLDDRKLQVAQRCGASQVINGAQADVAAEVSSLTEGRGADVVIEAIGLPSTYRQAIDLVSFTGRVVYIGYAKEDVAFTTKHFVSKELDILGSRNASHEDFQEVIRALSEGGIPIQQIITHRFPADKAAEAFATWAACPNDVIKMILEF